MATELEKLVFQIQADATKLKREMMKSQQTVSQSSDKMKRSLKGVQQEADKTGSNMAKLRRSTLALSGVLVAAGLAARKLSQDIVQARFSYDRIINTLKVVSGTQQGATEEFKFVQGIANDLGVDLERVGVSYGKLAAAAKGTALEGQGVRDIFEGMAQASVALNLSGEQASGALNAIQQMISKGNVQAEELRGQLGERLPGALQLASRAMGVTTQEMDKMLERGELTAVDLLPKLAKVLKETYGETARGAIGNVRQQTNLLKNATFELLLEMGKSGFIDAYSESLATLRSVIKDPTFVGQMKGLARGIGSVAQAAADAVQFLSEFATELESVYRGVKGEFLTPELPRGLSDMPLDALTKELQKQQDAADQLSATLKRAQGDMQTVRELLGIGADREELLLMSKTLEDNISIIDKYIARRQELNAKGDPNPPPLSLTRETLPEGVTKPLEALKQQNIVLAERLRIGGAETANQKVRLEQLKLALSLQASGLSLNEEVQSDYKKEFELREKLLETENKIAERKKMNARVAEMTRQIEDTRVQLTGRANGLTADQIELQRELLSLGINEGSVEAGVIRERVETLQRMNKELAFNRSLAEAASSVFDRFGSGIVRSMQEGTDAMEAFRNASVAALFDIQSEMIKLLVFNPLKQRLFQGLGMAFSAPPGAGNTLPTSGTGVGMQSTVTPSIGAGLAFRTAGIVPNATGGIINSPTQFMSNKGAGLMGEAGPEAILPLKRRNGVLGVEASGGRGDTIIHIDARGSNSDAGVMAAVQQGIAEAAPLLIDASVNQVISSRQRNPKLFTGSTQ